MAKNLDQNQKYSFALAFLTLVNPLRVADLPEEYMPLAILKMLETLPQKAVSPTVTDAVRNIFSATNDWDTEQIRAADEILAKQGAMTLSQARQEWSQKHRRR